MELKTKRILWVLHLLAWILFVGLSIEAAGFMVGAFYTLVNPAVVKKLWMWQEVDLAHLYQYSLQHFFSLTLLMSVVSLFKALLFYRIVMILYDKELSSRQPFSPKLGHFLYQVSYLSLLTGLFCWAGSEYTGYLLTQGLTLPDLRQLRLSGGDVWLFMGVTLLVIAQIFKRGVEIQSENELTV